MSNTFGDNVDVRLRIQNQRQFHDDAKQASGDIDKIGRSADTSSKKLDRTSRSASTGRRRLRSLGAAAIIAGAGLLSIGAAKSAIDTTVGLAKSTKALHTNLGFTNIEANRWAVAAKARDIDTSALSMSFTNLSKNAVAAAGGSRKHAGAIAREIGVLEARNEQIKAALSGSRAQQVLDLAHVRGNRQATASLRARGIVEGANLRTESAAIRKRETALKQQLRGLQGNKQAIAAFRTLGLTQKDLAKGLRPGGFQTLLNKVADGLARIHGSGRRAALVQKIFGRSSQLVRPILERGAASMNKSLRLADKYNVILTGKTKPSLDEMIVAQRELSVAQLGWQVTFATRVAPALTKLIGLLLNGSQWLAKHRTLVSFAIPMLAAFAVAIWLVNIAMSANPVVLVIAGLVALGVGLVIAYKKFGRFRAVVDAVFGFVKRHWPLVIGIFTGGIGLLVAYIVKHWDGLIDFFSKLPGRITGATRGMWDGIKHAFRSSINWIIRKWNDLEFHISAKKIHGHTVIPSVTIGTPNIPLLGTGGTISPGGMAVTGEAGPELVRHMGDAVEVTPLGDGRGGGAGLTAKAPVILKLDRRVLAQTYVEFALDELAAT